MDRPRAVPGQRLHRAAVAVAEVRSRVSARADRRVRGRAGDRGVDDVLQRRTSALCARGAHAGRGLRRGAGSVTMRAPGSRELAVMPAFRWHPQRFGQLPGVAKRRGGFARGRASTPIRTVVRARDSAASRLVWRNDRLRSFPRLPRAPDEPSAATRVVARRNALPLRRRPHRPAQPGRSVSRGYLDRA